MIAKLHDRADVFVKPDWDTLKVFVTIDRPDRDRLSKVYRQITPASLARFTAVMIALEPVWTDSFVPTHNGWRGYTNAR